MIDTTKVVIPEPIDVYRNRCEQLEELCRDLYREGCYYWLLTNNDPPYARSAWCDDFCSRMVELGLLEGESNANAKK